MGDGEQSPYENRVIQQGRIGGVGSFCKMMMIYYARLYRLEGSDYIGNLNSMLTSQPQTNLALKSTIRTIAESPRLALNSTSSARD